MARRDSFGDEYRLIISELVRARKSAGLTQWDLARAIGTDQSQISKFERFERRLDLIDYVRVCAATGLHPGALLQLLAQPARIGTRGPRKRAARPRRRKGRRSAGA